MPNFSKFSDFSLTFPDFSIFPTFSDRLLSFNRWTLLEKRKETKHKMKTEEIHTKQRYFCGNGSFNGRSEGMNV